MYNNLETFILRLDKINIKVELGCNYRWVYITSINGVFIKPEDYYQSRNGFNLGYAPIRIEEENFKFSNLSKTFKLIRKYAKNTNVH